MKKLSIFYYCDIWKKNAAVLISIISMYSFSIGLLFLNRHIIATFKYPLTLTLCHIIGKFIFSLGFQIAIELLYNIHRTQVTWTLYCKMILATAAASSLDIGLSNWSFEFITIALYTMTKSTSVIFVAAFSVILRLEKKSWSLLTVAVLIALGLFLFTFHYSEFNIIGFLLVLSASAISGLRWSLTQYLMQNEQYKLLDPIDTQYHFQPWMAMILFPLVLIFESEELFLDPYFFRPNSFSELCSHWSMIVFSCFLAIGLEIAEFSLVSRASSLTLSLASIVKEIVTIFLATYINGEKLPPINIIGFVICISGIVFHVYSKFKNEYKKISEIDGQCELLLETET